MTILLWIVGWFLLGVVGYIGIVSACRKVDGELTPKTMVVNIPSILFGPLAIIYSILFWLDVLADNIKKKSGWWDKNLWP